MKQCYALFAKENKGMDLTAVVPDNIDITKEIYKMVSDDNTLLYNMELKGVKSTKKGLVYSNDISLFNKTWLDMLINVLSVPLFSNKIKDFFENEMIDNNYLKWIKVNINGYEELKTYYIPEFKNRLDVLNMEKCTINKTDNSVIVPCFSYKKIQNYILFHKSQKEEYLWRVPSTVYISDETRKKIMKNKFTGIEYEKIRTSE